MGFKQRSSPLMQSFGTDLATQAAAVNAQQQQQLNSGSIATGLPGMVSGIQNQISRADNISSPTSPIVTGPGNYISGLSRLTSLKNNISPRPQTPISPKAFSNQGTIANMYGNSVPGTFNRSIGSPLNQTVDPLTGQTIDPTMDQSTVSMNPAIQGDTVIPPPTGVQVPITPTYDINQ
jgi:hypothetical protein